MLSLSLLPCVKKHLPAWSTIVVTLVLSACGSLPHRDGAPSSHPVDIQSLADPVPKIEPLSRYGNPANYEVFGVTYTPLKSSKGYSARGTASWYGTKFHGQLTSSREPYDMYKLTAAHKTLPLPSYVEVTNLENGKHIIVRVNDRGPFHDDRIIDLSYAAAYKLGFANKGTARVEIKAINPEQPLSNGIFYVQAGAFSDRENAELMQQQLQQSHVNSGIKIASYEGDATYYRVHLGPFKDRQSAMRFKEKLHRLGVTDTYLVSEEP